MAEEDRKVHYSKAHGNDYKGEKLKLLVSANDQDFTITKPIQLAATN